MHKPNHTRGTVSPCHASTVLPLVVAVLAYALAGAAGAASPDAGSPAPVVHIDPVPRFDASEAAALVEKPSIAAFKADKPRIPSGGSATLSWRVDNADSVSISNVGNVGRSGSRTVKPTQRTTYTLTARNGNGAVSKSVTVDITNLAAVIGKVELVKPVFVLENVAYNFVDKADTARWGSSKPRTFGATGGNLGWARVINSVRAEDNKDYTKVLQTIPENKANGFIYGEYSLTIPANAKFRATVGFTAGHGSTDGATVSVQVRPAKGRRVSPWKQVLTKTITRDGKLDPIEVDLKAYPNRYVRLRLVVNARSKAADDLVLWIAPRIIK